MCSNVTAARVMIPPPVFTLHTLHRSSNVGGHFAAPLKLSPNGYHKSRFWHTVYTTLREPSVDDLARLHTLGHESERACPVLSSARCLH